MAAPAPAPNARKTSRRRGKVCRLLVLFGITLLQSPAIFFFGQLKGLTSISINRCPKTPAAIEIRILRRFQIRKETTNPRREMLLEHVAIRTEGRIEASIHQTRHNLAESAA